MTIMTAESKAERAARSVARRRLTLELQAAERRVIAEAKVEGLGPLETEDDILALAEHLTRRR